MENRPEPPKSQEKTTKKLELSKAQAVGLTVLALVACYVGIRISGSGEPELRPYVEPPHATADLPESEYMVPVPSSIYTPEVGVAAPTREANPIGRETTKVSCENPADTSATHYRIEKTVAQDGNTDIIFVPEPGKIPDQPVLCVVKNDLATDVEITVRNTDVAEAGMLVVKDKNGKQYRLTSTGLSALPGSPPPWDISVETDIPEDGGDQIYKIKGLWQFHAYINAGLPPDQLPEIQLSTGTP
jgi:hypothetical protein